MMLLYSCFMLVITSGLHKDFCLGAKLERKQDFFDVDSFDNKREYGLSEIGKRGFSTFGFDYSTSSEYGIGGTSVVSSDFSNTRSGGGDDGLSSSPARDLIPPPPFYSSTTSSSTSRSDYPKHPRISSTATISTKDFPSSHHHHRSQISRRSPPHYHHQSPLNQYFDDFIGSGTSGRNSNAGNYGLVADNDGKLIGYRGSILPGYSDTQSIVSTTSSSIGPNSDNFIGGYFPSHSPTFSEYSTKPKFSSLASSASSGSYTSTPVYYPGREEDHTYRMRDTTSQGYDEEEQSPSLEDNDFTVGSSGTYQPSALPQRAAPPSPHHYHLREPDGYHGHSHIMETNRFLPYGSGGDPQPPGFSYEPLGKNHRLSYDYNEKRSYGLPSNSPQAGYDVHGINSVERGSSSPYGYVGLGYNDYVSS